MYKISEAVEVCSLAEASLENLQAQLNKLSVEYVPACKHIAQKPLLENQAEIPVPRPQVSGISVKVQKGPYELCCFCLLPENSQPQGSQLSLRQTPRLEHFVLN